MAMNIGQGSKVQLGRETTWGTPVAATHGITHKSESLKNVRDKKTEDSLVGGRAPRGMQTLGSKVEGDLSISIKPDEIGFLLALVLGNEESVTLETDASAAYRHVFEPLLTGSAPKVTVHVDRKVDVFRYISCKVDTFKLSGSAGGFLEGSMSLKGYDEDESGNIEAGVAASVLKGFRFADAGVTIDGASISALVTSFDLEIQNNLESDLYTLGSGAKQSEIEWQKIGISANVEFLYDSQSQAIHATQFKNDTNVALVITLISAEEVESGYPYELKISLPVAQINDSSMNLADAGRIKHTMSFTAQEDESNAAVSIEVVDGQSTAYI